MLRHAYADPERHRVSRTAVRHGIQPGDLPAIQPLFQYRIWQRMAPGDGPDRLADVIEQLRRRTGASTWKAAAGPATSPGSAATTRCWSRWSRPARCSTSGSCPGRPHRRPPLPQRAVPPARRRDQLLPLLGPGGLDRLRRRVIPSRRRNHHAVPRPDADPISQRLLFGPVHAGWRLDGPHHC